MDKCSSCNRAMTRLWYGRPMCEMHYDQKLKVERVKARLEEGVCIRCGGALDERDSLDQAVCSDCQYDDWHEDYPDVFPEEGGE